MKFLAWDVELSKAIYYAYPSKKPQYLKPEDIKHDQFMICASWKVIGQKHISSVSVLDDNKRFKNNFRDEYHVLKTLRDGLEEADVLIGHNVDGFDMKHFNWRLALYGLHPITPKETIDTLKLARKHWASPGNSMSFLATRLEIALKGKVPDEVWKAATDGCAKAIRDVVKYNRQDLRVQDPLYLKLRPFMKKHPHEGGGKCQFCSSLNLGVNKNMGKKIQYQCRDCGGCTTCKS